MRSFRISVENPVPGDDAADADTETTRIGYDPVAGGVSGWGLRQPTTTSTDPTPGGDRGDSGDGDGGDTITSTAVYDVYGNVTERIRPGSSGSDAGTVLTSFYGPEATGGCAGRSEWAGQPCASSSAAAPVGGSGSNVTVTVTGYNRLLEPGVATEVFVNGSRTATTGYDDAGRVISTAVTGGASGDDEVPRRKWISCWKDVAMSATRRRFTPEYKIEAAHRVIDSGRAIAEVARELGLNEMMLGDWARNLAGTWDQMFDAALRKFDRLWRSRSISKFGCLTGGDEGVYVRCSRRVWKI